MPGCEVEHVPLAEVKNRLSEVVVDRLEREHGRVVITKHGRPAGGHAQPRGPRVAEETLVILSDPELMAELRQADAEVAAGRTIPLSKQEALAELESMHSAHRGDYQVVYRIDERRRRLEVLALAHRADVYRRG